MTTSYGLQLNRGLLETHEACADKLGLESTVDVARGSKSCGASPQARETLKAHHLPVGTRVLLTTRAETISTRVTPTHIEEERVDTARDATKQRLLLLLVLLLLLLPSPLLLAT